MPEGLSNPASIDTWQVTAAEVDCGTGRITSSRGVPMLVGQTNTYAQGTWSALFYQAPAHATINAGTIYRAEQAQGPNDGFMGIIQQGGEYNVLYSLPRNCCDQGDWYVGNVASRGTFATPFSPENVVNLTISPDGGHWDVNATCDPNGNNNSSCTLAAGQWEYRIFGGEISLNAPKDPQASDTSGPLVTESPLRGTESITFSAADEGPGLAYAKSLVDGNVVQSQIIDTNGGHCVPVPGHDAYTWAYQLPCRTSVGGRTYSLNTAALPNGLHHVQVVIEDAAGNKSIVLDRMVDTENAGMGPLGALPGPGADSGRSTGVDAPNGTGASETAQLRLGVRGRITRTFAHRALRLAGRLLNAQGHPIVGATLDVSQQVAGSSRTQVVVHAHTGDDGSFIARVPGGPSRLIEVAYRAFSTDIGYAAEAKIAESVNAGVRLVVTPRRTSPEGTITLSGRVLGPVPRQGVIVDLLVHYRGRWEPFRTPRTDAAGHFAVTYQFQGALGRFPFRAEVPSSQADFSFARGLSEVVDVATD
ncbi:MAG TPA: hypothetical protein VES97_08815 [Solirubrobacteraceae bacterium]|nr:hypothetical protein [Solirubrobacteraceae bacterium]